MADSNPPKQNEQQAAAPNPSEPPKPVISKKRRLSSIWLLPLVVALAGGWLVYQNWVNKGPTITIFFDSGEGITPSKTPVKFKGVEMGMVSEVSLTEDKKQVAVTVALQKSAESLARKHSKFWLVQPKVSASGISGVETILSGMYIAVLPGNGEPTQRFNALKDGPLLDKQADDLVLVLKSDRLGSLSPGCPIYYRQVQVGLISEARLSKQANSVLIFARIKHNYAPLVHNGTVFWNVSGVGVDLGLFGSKIRTESLTSLLTGGVTFATPEGEAMGARAKRGDVFVLHSDPEDDWLKWAPKININPEDVTP